MNRLLANSKFGSAFTSYIIALLGKMSSINFSIELPPGQAKTVEQLPLGKSFHVTAVEVKLEPKRLNGVYLTELWRGSKKVFIPWKQPLSMLTILENTVIDGKLKYTLKFINEGKEAKTLTVKISGTFVQ